MSNIFKHWTVSTKGGRAINQDFSAVDDSNPAYFLAVVCDGMGGSEGGEIASGMAVNTIINYVKNATPAIYTTSMLHDAVLLANEKIWQTSRQHAHLSRMGTTVVALLLLPNGKGTVIHAGDSRCYHIRGKQRLYRTTDHSRVFELLQRGILDNEETARLSNDANVITRALGVKPNVELSQHDFGYQAGDRFLLSTDGIHGIMPEQALLQVLMSQASFKDAAETLATDANRIGIQQGGGHDNLTAIVVDYGTPNPKPTTTPNLLKTLSIALSIVLLATISYITWQWIGQSPTPNSQKTNLKNDSISTKTNKPSDKQKAENAEVFEYAQKVYQQAQHLIDSADVLVIVAQETWENMKKKDRQSINDIADKGRDIMKQTEAIRKKASDAQNATQKYDSTKIENAKTLVKEADSSLATLEQSYQGINAELRDIQQRLLNDQQRAQLEKRRKQEAAKKAEDAKKALQAKKEQEEREKQNAAEKKRKEDKAMEKEKEAKQARGQTNNVAPITPKQLPVKDTPKTLPKPPSKKGNETKISKSPSESPPR